MDEDFSIAFGSWFTGAQKIIEDYCVKQGLTYAKNTVLKYRVGGKFVIITRHDQNLEGAVSNSGSAHAFVALSDNQTVALGAIKRGDVMKPASYKAPAKHARGNIFDAKNGLGSMGQYGPAYL